MTNELLSLIVGYFACAQAAEERYLTPEEVKMCSIVYQEMKLAFVPGVDAEDYVELSPREQHAVNSAGYTAFYTWRQDNPDRVAYLERVAKGEIELGQAG